MLYMFDMFSPRCPKNSTKTQNQNFHFRIRFDQAILEGKSRTLLKSQLFKLLGPRQLFTVREIKAQTNTFVGRYFHNST